MNCSWAKKQIPAYIDGELGPASRWLVRQHLVACAGCFDEYENGDTLIDSVQELDEVAVPANMRTRLLVALSHETESAWSHWKIRVQNWMRPIAVPATGGLVSAIVLFVALMSNFTFIPGYLEADVPLTYLTKNLISSPSMSIAPSISVAVKESRGCLLAAGED